MPQGHLRRIADAHGRAAELYRQLGHLALRAGDTERARRYFRCSSGHDAEARQAIAAARTDVAPASARHDARCDDD